MLLLSTRVRKKQVKPRKDCIKRMWRGKNCTLNGVKELKATIQMPGWTGLTLEIDTEILNAIIAIEEVILRETALSHKKEVTEVKEEWEKEVVPEVCREIGVEEIEVEIETEETETEETEEKGVEEMWTEEIEADVIVGGQKVLANVGLRVKEQGVEKNDDHAEIAQEVILERKAEVVPERKAEALNVKENHAETRRAQVSWVVNQMKKNISKRLKQREQSSAQADRDLILQNLMVKMKKREAKIDLNLQQIKNTAVNRVRSPHKKTVLRKRKIVFYVKIEIRNNSPQPKKLSPHNKTKNQN
jgi:hypothetical protein